PGRPLSVLNSSCLNESATALLEFANDACILSAARLMSLSSVSSNNALIIPALPIKLGVQTSCRAGISTCCQPSPGSTDTNAGLNVTRWDGLQPQTRPKNPRATMGINIFL